MRVCITQLFLDFTTNKHSNCPRKTLSNDTRYKIWFFRAASPGRFSPYLIERNPSCEQCLCPESRTPVRGKLENSTKRWSITVPYHILIKRRCSRSSENVFSEQQFSFGVQSSAFLPALFRSTIFTVKKRLLSYLAACANPALNLSISLTR